jgi:hypothetical protein
LWEHGGGELKTDFARSLVGGWEMVGAPSGDGQGTVSSQFAGGIMLSWAQGAIMARAHC